MSMRSAIVNIETQMTQAEFEAWLLKNLKNISIVPESTTVEKVVECHNYERDSK